MAVLRNATTGSVIAGEAVYARSVVARTRGLMLRKELPEGAGLVIHPCGSIHMMFMRFPIDAVFYDNDGKVTRVARHLRRWTGLAFGGRGAKGVVELPAGAATSIEAGHTLEFDPPPAKRGRNEP